MHRPLQELTLVVQRHGTDEEFREFLHMLTNYALAGKGIASDLRPLVNDPNSRRLLECSLDLEEMAAMAVWFARHLRSVAERLEDAADTQLSQTE